MNFIIYFCTQLQQLFHLWIRHPSIEQVCFLSLTTFKYSAPTSPEATDDIVWRREFVFVWLLLIWWNHAMLTITDLQNILILNF